LRATIVVGLTLGLVACAHYASVQEKPATVPKNVPPRVAKAAAAPSITSTPATFGAIVLDEGYTRDGTPTKTPCGKKYLPSTLHTSKNRDGRKEVYWLVVNFCDVDAGLNKCDNPQMWTRHWKYTPAVLKDPSEWPGKCEGKDCPVTEIKDPFEGSCEFTNEERPIDVKFQQFRPIRCTLPKKAVKGTYHYDVVYKCGEYLENWDPIIIDDL
jgi:hypothetical protein